MRTVQDAIDALDVARLPFPKGMTALTITSPQPTVYNVTAVWDGTGLDPKGTMDWQYCGSWENVCRRILFDLMLDSIPVGTRIDLYNRKEG